MCLFTILNRSAAVSGCMTVKLHPPLNLHLPSITRSLQVIHALLSQSAPSLCLHFPPPPSSPDTSNLSKSPSVSPPPPPPFPPLHPAPPLPLRFPSAVTAPSHVCQSQLAHLLLHANAHRHVRHVHTCQSDMSVHERETARGRPPLCFRTSSPSLI